MVGYHLKNTLTENGHVARGVCVEKDGVLDTIVERTHIESARTARLTPRTTAQRGTRSMRTRPFP